MGVPYLHRPLPDKVQLRRHQSLTDGTAQRTQFLANQVMFDAATMNLRGT